MINRDKGNYCFICGIDNDTFERKANVRFLDCFLLQNNTSIASVCIKFSFSNLMCM